MLRIGKSRALPPALAPLARSCASRAAAAAEIAEKGAGLGIKFFQFSFVDLFGVQRSKLVPAQRVQELATNGAGFAGFATHIDMDPTMGDLLAIPDPATLTPLPWRPEVGWLSCNLVHNGTDLDHSPRNVLRKVVAALEAEGVAMKVGVECEFFLLDAPGPGEKPGAAPRIGDPLDTQGKPCYDSHALMRRYDYISELCTHMETMGWGPYQADHEDASGQFEINWDYDDALLTADRAVFFKYMARTLAEAHGLRATFMPKPFAGLTGSGCHAHVSLVSTTGQKQNVCGGGEAAMHGLSVTALKFLGGLLAHAPGYTAITNPSVNSFKRLNARSTTSGATWSPTAATWAGNNRSALVRVPSGAPRMELRLADMAANQYLLPAVMGAAGLDGLQGNVPIAPPPVNLNMYHAHDPAVAAALATAGKLPPNLREALNALDASAGLRRQLGDGFVDAYLKLRRAHWEAYTSHLSQWEIQEYLDC